jgi:hypothetical protein
MANDLDKHLQGRKTKYQKQFDKLSAIAQTTVLLSHAFNAR